MKRPILFSAPMVQAILAGSKTQTRRVVKLPHENSLGVWEKTTMGGPNMRDSKGNTHPEVEALYHTRTGDCITCPHGEPGDQLWVRETWGVISYELDAAGSLVDWVPDRPATAIHEMPFGNGYYSGHVIYRADGEFEFIDLDSGEENSQWKPSIHMPRIASRIQLEIVSVRVERLQDISEADAIAEGIDAQLCSELTTKSPWVGVYAPAAVHAYAALWESINGSGSWEANPWVWVIEFKRVERE